MNKMIEITVKATLDVGHFIGEFNVKLSVDPSEPGYWEPIEATNKFGDYVGADWLTNHIDSGLGKEIQQEVDAELSSRYEAQCDAMENR